MQYQSFLCIHGRDNTTRFIAITASVYLLALLGFLLLGQGGATLIYGCLLAPILGLSSYRRIKDAAQPSWLASLPLIPLFLFFVSLVSFGTGWLSGLCFLVASGLTLYIGLLPSTGDINSYHQGYAGPKAGMRKATSQRRVEPTLGGHAGYAHEERGNGLEAMDYGERKEEEGYDGPLSGAEAHTYAPASNAITFEHWKVWARQNMRLLAGVMVGILLLAVVSAVWNVAPEPDETDQETVQSQSLIEPPSLDREEAKIPDGFSVILEGDVLIVRWLGEADSVGEIWSLASAKGDKTCANLRFNNGSQYRPFMVELMADTAIEARFSPLDTQDIISDIAMRGSVKLCGYNFSLRGSQAALSQNAAFIPYL